MPHSDTARWRLRWRRPRSLTIPSEPSEPRSQSRGLRATILELIRELRHEWSRDRVGGLAAEIAFFALLGLFPAVIVLAAALGSLDSIIGGGAAADSEAWLLEQVSNVFGSDSTLSDTIAELFDRPNAGALTVGILLALYAASRGFVALVSALDLAYGHEQRRNWFSTRLVGLGLTVFTLVVMALVMTMLVVGPLLGTGEDLAERLGAGRAFATVWLWFRWPAVLLALLAWAATVYRVAPNHTAGSLRTWRRELPGAGFATVWWIAVSVGFRSYLDAVSRGANAVLGILGGALSLLLLLYLLAMGLLIGAEINAVLAARRRRRIQQRPVPSSE